MLLKASIFATPPIANGWTQRGDAAVGIGRRRQPRANCSGSEGKPAFTPYTRDCGGRTEDAATVWPDLAAPYLKSHEDVYCTRAGASAWQWNARSPAVLAALLKLAGFAVRMTLEGISILNRTSSGRARALLLLAGAERINPHQRRFFPLRGGPRAGMEHAPQRPL